MKEQEHFLCLLMNKPTDGLEDTLFITLLSEEDYDIRINDKLFGFPLHNINEGELFNLTVTYEKNSMIYKVTPGTPKDYLWVDNPKTIKTLYRLSIYRNEPDRTNWENITTNLIGKGITMRNNNIDEILK